VTVCSVCATAGEGAVSELSNVAWAKQLGVGEASIRRHYQHAERPERPEPTALAGGESETHTATGSSYVRFSEKPWGYNDYREFIRTQGQDPDKVTFNWGWTSNPAGGFWNKLNNVRPVEAADTQSLELDPVGILARLRAESPLRSGPLVLDADSDDSAFCLSINDIQLGQSYNGGSAATIENFYRLIELAKTRIHELRTIDRKLEGLVIVVGGDLGEGCVIYTNQAFNLDLDRKQQNEGIIALLLHALDELAPHFEWVKVLACKGNHGEHRITGKMTTLGDNDDTHAVEMAKLALSRDPSMQHIEWVIAEDEAAVAVDVYGHVLATTHGDVYAKGVSGVTTERKAHSWMKNMAASRKRFGKIADADVLVTHHFHHEESKDWGDTLWKQTPSQDRGSPGFSQATGTYSEPGMLTWVMTPTSRWKDEAVLR
jgi:hypothetical protein